MSTKNMPAEFYLKFWGVRGTVPVPGKNTLKYGGNTSCVEVICNNRQIILDAGTGIHALGRSTDILHTDILLSHSHLDHIQGLPFFRPLYQGGEANVALWAGHLQAPHTVEGVAEYLMSSPIFPLSIHDVRSRVEFNDFTAGETLVNSGFKKAGIVVQTLLLNHPDRATAYRITHEDKVVCYVTDVEHKPGTIEQSIVDFIKGADVFIYDCTFDDREFEKYIGWGHSTWQEAVRLADAANVRIPVIFHHDPLLTDQKLDERARDIESACPRAVVAYEGLVIDLK